MDCPNTGEKIACLTNKLFCFKTGKTAIVPLCAFY